MFHFEEKVSIRKYIFQRDTALRCCSIYKHPVSNNSVVHGLLAHNAMLNSGYASRCRYQQQKPSEPEELPFPQSASVP